PQGGRGPDRLRRPPGRIEAAHLARRLASPALHATAVADRDADRARAAVHHRRLPRCGRAARGPDPGREPSLRRARDDRARRPGHGQCHLPEHARHPARPPAVTGQRAALPAAIAAVALLGAASPLGAPAVLVLQAPLFLWLPGALLLGCTRAARELGFAP